MKKYSHQGVTLIELLVVITIMMTMVGLVAPLAMNTVDKAEAQSEYLSFCAILRRASIKAFVNGSGVYLELYENTIKVFKSSPTLTLSDNDNSNKLLFEQSYQYLYFADSTIKFNRNGVPNVVHIDVKQKNINRKVNVIELLEN